MFFRIYKKNISETRRKGDRDKSLTVVSDTAKVEGNSAYGSLLLNKDKFVNIKFIEGVENASKKVNEPLFVKLTELDSAKNYYEIQMAKKKNCTQYANPTWIFCFTICKTSYVTILL